MRALGTCGAGRAGIALLALGTLGARGAGVTLGTLRARQGGELLLGEVVVGERISLGAGRAGVTLVAFVALLSLRARSAGRAGVAFVALLSLGTLGTREGGELLLGEVLVGEGGALRPLRAGVALLALGALRPGIALVAFSTRRTGRHPDQHAGRIGGVNVEVGSVWEFYNDRGSDRRCSHYSHGLSMMFFLRLIWNVWVYR